MSGFQRYLLGVQYIGTKYSGWARNTESVLPSLENTVQLALDKFTIGGDNNRNFKGSSRTDAGVHAIRNTFHMDCRRINRYTGQVRDPFIPSDVQKGLNFYLDPTKSGVNIVDVRPVGEEFHSRHSAKARTYTYRILSPLESVGSDIAYQRYQLFHTDRAWCIPQCLDVEAMREAASTLFLGEKDYSTVRNSGCQSPTPFRNVLAIDVQSSSGNFATTSIYNGNTYNLLMDEEKMCLVTITITADSFLLRMVRNIAALLVEVGSGRLSLSHATHLMALKDRSKLGLRPAPAHGLYLADVHY